MGAINVIDELETTLDEPLLSPHDHTLLLRAVQLHAPAIAAALGPIARLRPLAPAPVLEAIASLAGIDEKTRLTATQVLSFMATLTGTPLPARYAATLATLDAALSPARTPVAVVVALTGLKEAGTHAAIAGFLPGIESAIDLIGDALGSAVTSMTGVTVFGRANPAAVARACARGCVNGALIGSITSLPPSVSGAAGAVAGSITTLLAVTMDAQRH